MGILTPIVFDFSSRNVTGTTQKQLANPVELLNAVGKLMMQLLIDRPNVSWDDTPTYKKQYGSVEKITRARELALF